ncbi:MAG: histidinol dehydrogenase [Aestuariivirga sp.]
MTKINFHELAKLSPAQRQRLLTRVEGDLTDFEAKVKPIIAAVRAEGDVALARFANLFDKSPVTADALMATPEDYAEAERTLAPDVKAAMEFAATNIRTFHQRQKPEEKWMMEVSPGAFGGERWSAIPSVACYVPRGKGSFPSAALMVSIPAKVAGVEHVIMVTPPGPDGKIDDATLVAARMAGVDAVYKAGGAQAIAAVAYGTKTIPSVAKVVGPGSPWVTVAKRLVSHMMDVGPPAGVSEVIVMADDSVSGELAALDLLVECEHGPDSSGYLVTWSERVAREALAALPKYLALMSKQRAEFATTVLSGPVGGIVLARDEDEAIAFCNDYAPEHLEVLSETPHRYLDSLKHAAEILLGKHTPTTLGNYVIGPDHVLPTGGWARTASALSVFDFMKRTSIVEVKAEGYATLAKHARVFAKYEGFDAHANAVSELRDKLLK